MPMLATKTMLGFSTGSVSVYLAFAVDPIKGEISFLFELVQVFQVVADEDRLKFFNHSRFNSSFCLNINLIFNLDKMLCYY